MSNIDKRIQVNTIIENQLPEFVVSDFPNATEFLKQYYISQEFQGGPSDLINNFDQYLKVDNLVPEVVVGVTTISADVSITDTTITVPSTKGFPSEYGLLKIDDEIISYTGITSTSFTGCIRGFSGITGFNVGVSSSLLEVNRESLKFNETSATTHTSGSTLTNLSVLFIQEFFKKIKKSFLPGLENNNFSEDLDAFRLIREAELEIGGQVINKIYGDWMQIWARLTYCSDDSSGDKLTSCMTALGGIDGEKIHIPFLFWWVLNPSLALPLVSLQYHQIKINMIIDSAIQTGNFPNLEMADAKVWATYGYLDTTERRKFAENTHEYLITEVQYTSKDYPLRESELQIPLNFLNHPVKYLMWWGNLNTSVENATALYTTAKITMNGQDRIKERSMDYFERYQPYLHFNGCPPTEGVENASVYSFALDGSQHQPSGACNFSRVDDSKLIIKRDSTVSDAAWGPGTWFVYAMNYNILRIHEGMAGVAFSN